MSDSQVLSKARLGVASLVLAHTNTSTEERAAAQPSGTVRCADSTQSELAGCATAVGESLQCKFPMKLQCMCVCVFGSHAKRRRTHRRCRCSALQ